MTAVEGNKAGWNVTDLERMLALPPLEHPSQPSERRSSLASDLERVCTDGERTAHLTRLAGTLYAKGTDEQAVITIARLWNRGNKPPMNDARLVAHCRGIGRAHAKNHPDETSGHSHLSAPLFHLDSARVDHMLGMEPPPRRWLLKNCLPLGKVGAVVAPGGTGKSQFLLQLGVSVATGLPLCGHFEVSEHGGVLILAAEDDEEELHRRLFRVAASLSLRHPEDIELFQKIKRNLYVRSMVAENNLMTRVSERGLVELSPYAERLALTAADIKDLRLIVVDPVSRFRDGDENSAQHATRFVEALERLRDATQASVLAAHHTSKGSQNRSDSSQDDSRGSSAFTDGVRWQLNLKRSGGQGGVLRGIPEADRRNYLSAEIVKSNYAPPSEPVLLRRSEDGFLEKVTIEQVGGATSTLALVRTLLREHADKGKYFTRSGFLNQYAGRDKILRVGDNTLRDQLKGWIASGDLALKDHKLIVPDAISSRKIYPSTKAP